MLQGKNATKEIIANLVHRKLTPRKREDVFFNFVYAAC